MKPTAIDPTAFRKLGPGEQIHALRGCTVERAFTFDRAGIDEEKRTVWLSIASNQAYERWWGIEILDMQKKSIRSERLKKGLPILVDHDSTDIVGKAESYEFTTDGKLRLLARFGRSARAEEIWRDVLDGIRTDTSVGYVIHDLVLERQEEGKSSYRVTDWEPLEGSLVSIPADPTVGVGRHHEPPPRKDNTMTPEEIRAEAERLAREKIEAERSAAAAEAQRAVESKAAIERESARMQAILAAGDLFPTQGGPELARELIKNPAATEETFKARMFEKQTNVQKPTTTAAPHEERGNYGSGARQVILRGQKLRAFTQDLRYTDGSKIDPLECAYRSGMWLMATVFGNQKAAKWCSERGLLVEQRVMQVGDSALGGYLVPNEMEQAIIDLREQYGLARRLARRRPMASDTKSIPKRTGGVTAYFVNEDNTGVTASDKGWGNVNLTAKTLAALTLVTKNLEEDAMIDVVDDLAQEMAYAFAVKEDQCWLIGDGSSTYGGMTGLVTLFEASALASRFEAATGHDTFAEFDNADIAGVMGALADFAGINPQWVCSKTFQHNVFTRLSLAAGGNNAVDLTTGRPRQQYQGYDVNTSELMSKVLTDVSDKAVALFGDFTQSSSFGDRRGIMIEVLRERYAEKLQIGVLAHERFHIVNHDVGTTTVKGPVAALYGE